MTPAASSPLLAGISVTLLILALGAFFLLRSAGRVDLRRSVLIHVPLSRAWLTARNLSWLVSPHLKIEGRGGIDEWILREGDGTSVGSLWRGVGRWNGFPYWVDLEMAIVRPERQVAITIRRDSLGTHLWVREHLGSLTLEQAGPETTKATWRLRARLVGLRPRIESRIRSRRLSARLLDLSLRSIKSDLESEFDTETRTLLLDGAAGDARDGGRSISPGFPRAGGHPPLAAGDDPGLRRRPPDGDSAP